MSDTAIQFFITIETDKSGLLNHDIWT